MRRVMAPDPGSASCDYAGGRISPRGSTLTIKHGRGSTRVEEELELDRPGEVTGEDAYSNRDLSQHGLPEDQ